MPSINRLATVIVVSILIAIGCFLFFSPAKKRELTFEDISNDSREFEFQSAEVNGVKYKAKDQLIRLPKGAKLDINVSFEKTRTAGMVKAGAVKVMRPHKDGIEVLQGASFQGATQTGSTFTIPVSITIPKDVEPGKALLNFSSGKRTYVELTASIE